MSDVAPAAEPAVEPVAPVPEPVAEPQPPAAPVDEDAALDAALEQNAITINHQGDKLVPLSAVTTLREKIKTDLKPKAARAEQLDAENAQLRQQLDEARPLAEAFKAVASAQQAQQPQPQASAVPQDDPLAEEIARVTDLYDEHGQPHKEKGKQLADIVRKVAADVAAQQTAPFAQQQLQQQAALMMERAKATKINGKTADPAIIEGMFQRVAAQPGGLQSLTDPNHAALIVQIAYAQTEHANAGKAPLATPAAAPLPPPLVTEAAGGKAAALPTLNAGDRKTARDLGLTDVEYSKRLAAMPWRK